MCLDDSPARSLSAIHLCAVPSKFKLVRPVGDEIEGEDSEIKGTLNCGIENLESICCDLTSDRLIVLG
jgi:hypothetical protein